LRRASLARLLCIAGSLVIGAVLFFLVINLLVTVIKAKGGMIAFGALAGIVASGLAALVFTFGMPAYYAAGIRRGELLPRALLVTSIQALLFLLLRVLHFVVVFFQRPSASDYALGAAGLVAAAACGIAAIRGFASARERRRRAIEVPSP
jgi:hypothetical protein